MNLCAHRRSRRVTALRSSGEVRSARGENHVLDDGRRLLILGILAAGLAGAGVLVARSSTSGQEGSKKVERRTQGPSGQPGPIDVIVPNLPGTVGAPIDKGPFRLLPFGFNPTPRTASSGTPAMVNEEPADLTDPTLLAEAPFAAAVSYIPPGFSSATPTVGIVVNGKATEILWRFPGPAASEIQISRGLRTLPVEIGAGRR
jgi:hypothetical protein